MKRYLLAHDLGTSGNKAVLFDTQTLSIVGDCTEVYQTYYPQDGCAEHNPEHWWQAVCTATKKLLTGTGISANDIAAVSFSAIMNTCLPVDKNGKPLCNAVIWADQRGAEQLNKLYSAADENTFYTTTGHRINGTYSIAKMLWLQEHKPEIFDAAYKFLQVKDYVIHKMTGNFMSDYSDASHVGCLNRNTKKYWSKLLEALHIPEEKLPELKKSTDAAGTLISSAAEECGLIAGIPVIVGGGDGCCATAGAGVYKTGSAYNALGTSSWNGTLSKTPLADPDKTCFSLIHLDGEQYLSLGTMQSAGHSIEWLMANLFPDFQTNKTSCFAYVNDEIRKQLESGNTSQLIYLPYLLGERSPWWNSNARGAFVGLNASTGKIDMLRSCMEGVAFNLKIILNSLEKSLGPLSMRVIGGGAKNKTWLKILASVWGREIGIPKHLSQATSLGAILCAGIGSGIFNDFSVIEKINPIGSAIPPDEKLAHAYESRYDIFIKTYKALVPVYEALRQSGG